MSSCVAELEPFLQDFNHHCFHVGMAVFPLCAGERRTEAAQTLPADGWKSKPERGWSDHKAAFSAAAFICLLSRPRSWPVTTHCCVMFPFSVVPLKSALIVADFTLFACYLATGTDGSFSHLNQTGTKNWAVLSTYLLAPFSAEDVSGVFCGFSATKEFLKIVNSAGYGELKRGQQGMGVMPRCWCKGF